MLKTILESLRKKSMSLSDLPETSRVPGHAGNPTIDGLNIEAASIDDLAFAIQGLEDELSDICKKFNALRKLHDVARNRGALGTDKIGEIFAVEV